MKTSFASPETLVIPFYNQIASYYWIYHWKIDLFMSTTASQALSQGFPSGFQSTEGHRFKSTDSIDSVDKLRISNLAKEPNPFEQSFGKSAQATDETETPNSKPTLPSISLISQSARFLQDEPVKLSPIILDPVTYKSQPQTYHSLQNPVHPPISTNQANVGNQASAHSMAMSQYASNSIYHHPSISSHPSQMMQHPYQKPHGYLSTVSMDPASLISNNSTPILHLNPYSSNGMLPPDFKGHIPMMPPLYSIPTSPKPKRSAGGRKRLPTDGMSPKKIDFLERNRKAALKCRQRKKMNFVELRRTLSC
ncbi:hypothetical protein DSO57_1037163 [Entomophthora muscae]|uniref:Uncharacterized protein n=1 Tax=Entomophthora muscae TaxID=34485 RepID=A0ACC2SN52_9FUNG|nr:hypothetical protein DSO57_1037163 [Entomophthora muscae]